MVLAAFPTEVSLSASSLVFSGAEGSEITFLLPKDYPGPGVRISSISVSCRALSNQESERIKRALLEAAVGQRHKEGEEFTSTLFDLISLANTLVADHCQSGPEVERGGKCVPSSTYLGTEKNEDMEPVIDRCLIHFHHIMSSKKKSYIESEAERCLQKALLNTAFVSSIFLTLFHPPPLSACTWAGYGVTDSQAVSSSRGREKVLGCI